MRKILAIPILFGVGLLMSAGVLMAAPKEPLTIRKTITGVVATPTPTSTTTTTDKSKTPAPLPRFVFGQNAVVTDDTDRDLFIAGKSVIVAGKVNGDLFVAGGTVNVKGDVTGNIVAAGGTVTVNGNVGKNIIMAGGDIQVSTTSHTNGYLLAAGGTLNIQGKVDGSTKFVGGELALGSSTVIGGELQANVDSATGIDNAKINGTKSVAINPEPSTTTKQPRKEIASAFGIWEIVSFLGKALVLLVLLRLFSTQLTGIAANVVSSPMAALGWGLIKLIVVPFAILLMCITVIGLPLGMLTVVVYIVALYMAQFVTALSLGKFINDRWLKNTNGYLVGMVGLVILAILTIIPVVGWLVKLLSLLLGLGGIMQWEKSLFSGNAKK